MRFVAAAKIHWELSGEAAVGTVACTPHSGSTTIRWADETADVEGWLLARGNESAWYQHNPGWWVHWYWQGNNACFRTSFSRECTQGYIICIFFFWAQHSCRTIQIFWMLTYQENQTGHFVLFYEWMEQLLWVDSFLVSGLKSKKPFLNMNL